MDEKVKIVSKSFDKTIEISQEGINQYETLPACIVNTMQFVKYKDNQRSSTNDSGNPYIKEFINPQRGLKFLDNGCCLNLMKRGYQDWLSVYYGLDISPKILDVLEQYISLNNISIGKIVYADMANIPFENQYFDIADCIGSLECLL